MVCYRKYKIGGNILKNELFKIGSVTVYGYGLMIAIAIFSAYLTAEYRAKKKKLEYEKIFNLTIWCAIGGILGAKLLYYITVIPDIMKDPSILWKFGDGFVVYGGIICGILAGYLYCKKHKWNFLEYFDLVMPSIALAQGFGRIGCFLSGCCYGITTDSCIGITFHSSDYAPNGISLIPTQLISSGLNFLHFGILLLIAKKNKVHGVIAGCYLVFYSAGRFVLEFFRGDLERGSVGNLTTSQFISIFLFLFGLGIIIVQTSRYKKQKAIEGIGKANILTDGTEDLNAEAFNEDSKYEESDYEEEEGEEEFEADDFESNEFEADDSEEEFELEENEEEESEEEEFEVVDSEEFEANEHEMKEYESEEYDSQEAKVDEFESDEVEAKEKEE